MARAAVKAKQAQKAKVQSAQKTRARGRRKHASGGNPNQQLFFVRMRRSARPMYFILAVLFAATFAFLGVGSGSGGLEQLFTNLNIFHSGGTSVSKAFNDVQKHPTDPTARRALATAYEAKGDTFLAIQALEEYTSMRPKDAKAWTELAGLQTTAAQDNLTQYQSALANEQLAAPSQGLVPKATSPLGKALGSNPMNRRPRPCRTPTRTVSGSRCRPTTPAPSRRTRRSRRSSRGTQMRNSSSRRPPRHSATRRRRSPRTGST